jgi:hypothetical protein
VAYTFKHGDRPLEGVTIQRAVGRGGFGEVYYALTDSGKQVALKYLRDNPEIELRGIAHVMNLKSPNLITIYDVRRNLESDPFVIMEYVSGPSLRDLLIAEPNGLGTQKAAFFLCNIAAGLNYLHERGIVHRDLKPGNIFYDDGYVKIGDYGLSKHISVSRHSGQTVSVGTVHYMAPEIGSGTYTKAIDIYALGVILYEMITGRLPFTGSSMGEVLMRHLSEQPDVSGVPEPFARVIAKALAKDPHDRYQDVNEMVDALRASTELSASIASFDPATLSGVPRGEPVDDPDRTVTTPPKPPPIPPLDARAAAEPVLAQPIADERARRAHRGARAARHVDAAFEKVGLDPRQRRPQVLTLLVVVVAVAMGLGLISGNGDWPQAAVAVGLFLIGGTIGPLLAYSKILQRNLTRNSFLDRIVYAGTAVVFMIPAIAMSDAELDSDFALLAVPIAATLFLCNWTKRIEDGRRQRIRGGQAMWPAVLGLIGAAMVEADEYMWVGAGICATLSLLTQATAAMWPFGAVVRPVVGGARGYRGRQFHRHAVAGAVAGVARAGEHIGRAVERVGERLSHVVEKGESQEEEDSAVGAQRPAEVPPTAEAQPPAQTVYIDPAAPSFVGRTANAGLSLIGKLLLLAGISAALFYPSEIKLDQPSAIWKNGTVYEDGDPLVTIPAAALLVPLVLGSILLIAARRNDGAAHFLRGFFGCGFAVGAAIAAVGPAAKAVQKFLTTNNWGSLDPDTASVLIGIAFALALALALLFWPKRQRSKPVVI